MYARIKTQIPTGHDDGVSQTDANMSQKTGGGTTNSEVPCMCLGLDIMPDLLVKSMTTAPQ